jgi:transcription termination/antitermination protein NusG
MEAATEEAHAPDDEQELAPELPWYCVFVWDTRMVDFTRRQIIAQGLGNKIRRIVDPKCKQQVFERGKKVLRDKRLLEGYCFIECDLDDDVWHFIDTISGVVWVSYVAADLLSPQELEQGIRPLALTSMEVHNILSLMRQRRTIDMTFNINDTVQIKTGPFERFIGRVVDIKHKKDLVCVETVVFKRPTVIDCPFDILEKVD